MIRCKVSRRGDKSFQRKSSERGRDREGDENKGSGWGDALFQMPLFSSSSLFT